jgi:hypothetical protein
MARILTAFTILLPDGFEEQGDRLVGPGGDALRVTEVAIGGGGPEAQQRIVRDRLVQGAIKDVQRDSCQPDLEVMVPLSKAPGAAGLDTWSLVSRSAAGRLVAHAVVASDAAVAVLSWEGRATQESVAVWFGVLESLRPVET